ncbi:hypothetical protein ZEAMMB73_Zm00001d012768 [Zea mays]|uniref:Uncharacterized protein n=2 Tax=Zea mays TaxID=4577 RepID=A0A1D6GCB6_MAIZE|nr:hypothetical protein ZEAMMB73_Zm00001d012768 [Zea mays]
MFRNNPGLGKVSTFSPIVKNWASNREPKEEGLESCVCLCGCAMATKGSDPASPASAPPPPPKRRKIEPPRRLLRVRCQRELISTKLERQRDLPSLKRSMRDALEAIKASIPSLGITLFLSYQRTISFIRPGPNDEQEWLFVTNRMTTKFCNFL